MQTVVSNQNFGNSLSKGKEYQVVKETQFQFLIVDDQGDEIGYSKRRFEHVSTIDQLRSEIKQSASFFEDDEEQECITIDLKLFESIFDKYKSKENGKLQF